MVRRRKILLAGLGAVSAVLTSCNFTTSTAGNIAASGGGRVAAADYSSITGTNATSITASSVTITLRAKQSGPIAGVVPTFTATPTSTDDVSFTCGQTNAEGVAQCSFRSYEVTMGRTLKITSPIEKSGSTVTFTRAASKIAITQDVAGTGISRQAIATQPIVALQDPLSVTLTGETSNVTVSLQAVSQTTSGTPKIYRNGAVCGTTCTIPAVAGVVDFSLAANRLGVDLAGTYKFVFSSGSLTTATSASFTVTNGVGASIAFTSSPQTTLASLENFNPMPVVKIYDADLNVVTSDPVAGGVDDAAVTVTLALVANSGAGTLLGQNTIVTESGVGNYTDNGLRVDSNTGGVFYLTASATLAAGAVTANSSTFTVTRAGIPSKMEFSQQPSTTTTTTATIPRSSIVRVLDDFGTLVTTNSGLQVTMSVLGCTATLGGTTTRTVINGLATFNDLTLTDAAAPVDCQLRASAIYGGVTFVKNSQNVRVSAAGITPYQIVWTNTPQTTGVGQTITAAGPVSLRMEVRDNANNLVAGDNSTTATMTVALGNGTLGGTLAQTAANGVISFNDLTLTQTGTHQLKASSSGLVAGTSGAFVINTAGVASRLKFTTTADPGTQVAGTLFANNSVPANGFGTTVLEVQVVDDLGSLVTSANNYSVTIACTNPTSGCTLGGITTASTVSGLASFTTGYGLYLTNSGTNIQFTATASGLTSAQTTFPIVVDAGATNAVQSSIAATCPTATASTTGSQLIIYYKDQFGNAKVGYAGGTISTTHLSGTLAGTCSIACGATDSDGKSSCVFSCTDSGSYRFSVSGTDGSFTKTAVCAIP